MIVEGLTWHLSAFGVGNGRRWLRDYMRRACIMLKRGKRVGWHGLESCSKPASARGQEYYVESGINGTRMGTSENK